MICTRRLLSVISAFCLAACVTGSQNSTERSLYPPETARHRASYIADGSQEMVVTAHPIATQAGIAMLEAGGNAVDAATAASFTLSVVRPHSTGIGGGGFLLYYDAEKKGVKVFDFRERAPFRARVDMFLDDKGDPADFSYNGKQIPNASLNGHLSAGTPGLVAGLVATHQRFGRLPMAKVLEPAIKAAKEGFEVYPELSEAIASRAEVLQTFEGTRDIFFPGGKALKTGDLLAQKDLAWTLEQIAARGHDGFYKGEVARRLIAEMKAGGGIISQKDLDAYQVMEREPIKGDYRGYKVYSMPPPSSGGTHIVQMLNILENFEVNKLPHNSAERIQLLTEAMRRAYADRAKYLGDSDFVKVPINGLTSKAYARQLAKGINLDKAGNSQELAAGDPTPYESGSTTHLSVVDKWGNGVSTTQTINYTFGSGVVARGTGIILNDEMDDFSKKPGVPNAFGLVGAEANAIKARKAMLSSMSPTLVFDKNGQLKWLLGSPGGSRIITATLQTIVNLIDYGMSLPDAVHAHRVHHQWLPDQIFYEPNGMSEAVRNRLTSLGYKLEIASQIGDVQAIAKTESGWQGVSDTRSTGQPMGR